MPWKRRFEDHVELPNGKMAKHPKWQTAMHVLIDVAEGRGPVMFARIGMLQAIQRDAEAKFGPGKRKPTKKWSRRSGSRQ